MLLQDYLDIIQNEQLSTIGKGLSTIYKGSSKLLHYGASASNKLKMTDLKNYLLKHRDATENISRILKNNPSPENIKAVLSRISRKVSITFIVGLIILYAYKKYLRNLSASARYCKGTSGIQKTACIRKYKIKILMERLKDLKDGKQYCSKSKNSEKCKKQIDNKIKKLIERIRVLQTIEEKRKSKNL